MSEISVYKSGDHGWVLSNRDLERDLRPSIGMFDEDTARQLAVWVAAQIAIARKEVWEKAAKELKTLFDDRDFRENWTSWQHQAADGLVASFADCAQGDQEKRMF